MRMRAIPYIPSSVNFSSMAPGQENALYDESEEQRRDSEIDKELILLSTLKGLDSDKERMVVVFEVLRELGFALDYGSCASALGIQLRWYMRVKRNVQEKVKHITTNE
jgi:hypothetical protein